MESWRKVWREGVVPLLSTDSLEALRRGLLADDTRLVQGATTTPPPLPSVQDWPVEAACALGYCGWQGEGLGTVGEVEEFFAHLCFEVDARLGEPGAAAASSTGSTRRRGPRCAASCWPRSRWP